MFNFYARFFSYYFCFILIDLKLLNADQSFEMSPRTVIHDLRAAAVWHGDLLCAARDT